MTVFARLALEQPHEAAAMGARPAPERHTRLPRDMLAALDRHPASAPVLVDLDETLFLRNSTEEYLNCIRPATLGALFLRALDVLAPWRWVPHPRRHEARDWVRVWVCTFLFPWTLIVWRRRVGALAASHTNEPLLTALGPFRTECAIVTMGFRFIVAPLVRAMGMGRAELIACGGPFRSLGQRLRGKRALVGNRWAPETLRTALAVTDSRFDLDLLDQVGTPCLTVWPDARYVPAHEEAYFPFLYLERAKRPGQRYFARVVLYDEGLTLLLACSWLSPHPLWHVPATLLFLLSFWCVYELGYVENDRIGQSHESAPCLSETYGRYLHRVKESSAWAWAAVLAAAGAVLLTFADAGVPRLPSFVELAWLLVPWLLMLGAMRGTYWLYNHLEVESRLWVYPLLQAFKGFGFLTVLSTNIIGAAAFFAAACGRWFPYAIYRRGGDRRHFPEQLIRVVLFVALLGMVAAAQRSALPELFSVQAGVISVWLAWRARHQFRALVARATLLRPRIDPEA